MQPSVSSSYKFHSEIGFGMIELVVVMFLGMMMLAASVQVAMSSQKLYQQDLVRTRLNQNLRSALDIVGIDARQAGENLTAAFPAVEVINGGAGPDELIIRRNLVDEVLNVCAPLAQNSSSSSIQFSDINSVEAACIPANQTQSYNSWQAYRTSNGNRVEAYVFDTSTKIGQFVTYSTEATVSGDYFLTLTQPATWSTTYSVGSAAVYVLEEWHYRVNNNYLQVIVNRDVANAMNVVWGITDLQAVVHMQDGTTKTSFTVADSWALISNIEVTLTGEEEGWGNDYTRTAAARYVPRNILSN